MKKNNQGIAVITGASSGIGEAFARKLASLGYDLVLIARRKERLEKIRAEILKKTSIHINLVPADLTKDSDIQKIKKQINKIENLTMLVNNAGFAVRGEFHDGQIEKYLSMIKVHIIASIHLTRTVVPIMIRRGGGGIIFLSSMASYFPIAGNGVYSGTKAFLNLFAQSLQKEVKDHHIKVQALCPGFTHTGFHDTEEYREVDFSGFPEWVWMEAEDVVGQSLKALKKKKVIFIPGWKNRMGKRMATILSRLPSGQKIQTRAAKMQTRRQ